MRSGHGRAEPDEVGLVQQTTLTRGCAATALAVAGLAGLVAIGLYVLATDTQRSPPRPSADARGTGGARYRVFEDASSRYRLELPAHWVSVERGGARLFSGPEGAPDRDTTINVQVVAVAPGSSLSGQVEELKRQWSRLPGYELRASRSTRVRGRPAADVQAAYRVDGRGRFVQRQVIVAREPFYYWIGYTAPERLFDTHAGVLVHALDTLSFGPPRR